MLSSLRKCYALLGKLLNEELVRYLCKDTNTVSGLTLSVLSGSMLQSLNYDESVSNQLMAYLSVDLDYCTDTTVIIINRLVN